MNKNKTKQKIGLSLIILLVITIVVYLKYSGILGYMTSLEQLKDYIEGFGSKAYIVFFILQLISIIIAPIPSNVTAVAGAMIFGMWGSFIITILAIICGSAIVFSLSRIYGKAFTEKFMSQKSLKKYENLINSSKGEITIALMLLFPFFPDDIINFLVGLSGMSFKKYFIILILTRPWEILIASAMGSASITVPLWILGLIIAVSIVLIINSNKIEDKLTKIIKAI